MSVGGFPSSLVTHPHPTQQKRQRDTILSDGGDRLGTSVDLEAPPGAPAEPSAEATVEEASAGATAEEATAGAKAEAATAGGTAEATAEEASAGKTAVADVVERWVG